MKPKMPNNKRRKNNISFARPIGPRRKTLVDEGVGYCWDCGRPKHGCKCSNHIYQRAYYVPAVMGTVDGDYTDGFSPPMD